MFGKNIFSVYEKSRPQWKQLDNKYAIDLFNQTSEAVFSVIDKEERTPDKKRMKLLDFDPQQLTRAQTLLHTSQVLWFFLVQAWFLLKLTVFSQLLITTNIYYFSNCSGETFYKILQNARNTNKY